MDLWSLYTPEELLKIVVPSVISAICIVIIGGLFAKIDAKLSKKAKRPLWFFTPRKLLVNSLPEPITKSTISIQLHGELQGHWVDCPNLALSYLYIWNSGEETITADEQMEGIPLLITGKSGVTVLNVTGKYWSKNPNDIKVICNNNQWEIKFFQLEPKHGALFQVIHIGEPAVKEKIKKFPIVSKDDVDPNHVFLTIENERDGFKSNNSNDTEKAIKRIGQKKDLPALPVGSIIGCLLAFLVMTPATWAFILRPNMFESLESFLSFLLVIYLDYWLIRWMKHTYISWKDAFYLPGELSKIDLEEIETITKKQSTAISV